MLSHPVASFFSSEHFFVVPTPPEEIQQIRAKPLLSTHKGVCSVFLFLFLVSQYSLPDPRARPTNAPRNSPKRVIASHIPLRLPMRFHCLVEVQHILPKSNAGAPVLPTGGWGGGTMCAHLHYGRSRRENWRMKGMGVRA